MRSKIWICVILACAAVPTAAAGAKLAGKVLDRAALMKVKTYCVDTSSLVQFPGPYDQAWIPVVRDLIKEESGPKGLLSKLPWKLEADCSAPGVDAVLRFAFGRVLLTTTPTYPVLGALLRVSDKASWQVIYQAVAETPDSRNRMTADDGNGDRPATDQPQPDPDLGREVARSALQELVSDVKTISKNP